MLVRMLEVVKYKGDASSWGACSERCTSRYYKIRTPRRVELEVSTRRAPPMLSSRFPSMSHDTMTRYRPTSIR